MELSGAGVLLELETLLGTGLVLGLLSPDFFAEEDTDPRGNVSAWATSGFLLICDAEADPTEVRGAVGFDVAMGLPCAIFPTRSPGDRAIWPLSPRLGIRLRHGKREEAP